MKIDWFISILIPEMVDLSSVFGEAVVASQGGGSEIEGLQKGLTETLLFCCQWRKAISHMTKSLWKVVCICVKTMCIVPDFNLSTGSSNWHF